MLSQFFKNKNNCAPRESKRYAHLRIFGLIITGLTMLGVLGTVLLIYQNIYLAIDRTREQIIIDPIFTQEAIDFTRLENVQKTWDERVNTRMIEVKKNPFSMTTSTAL